MEYEPWGMPPNTDETVWLMEQGIVTRDEELIARYYHAKWAAARQQRQWIRDSLKGDH